MEDVNWDRKNEDQLIMIEQLQREMNSTVDALYHRNSTHPQYPPAAGAPHHHQSYDDNAHLQPQPQLMGANTGSLPINKFGYQDSGSMLEFLRSSQEVTARLQVEQQLTLAECQRLQLENAALRDQNKRLLDDKEHISLARRDAEGKLSFRLNQVLELEEKALAFDRITNESKERISTLEFQLKEAQQLLSKSETDMRVSHVRNAFLEKSVAEYKIHATGVPMELYSTLKDESKTVIDELRKDLHDIRHRYGAPEHHESPKKRGHGVKRPSDPPAHTTAENASHPERSATVPVHAPTHTHGPTPVPFPATVPTAPSPSLGEGIIHQENEHAGVAMPPPPDSEASAFNFTIKLPKATTSSLSKKTSDNLAKSKIAPVNKMDQSTIEKLLSVEKVTPVNATSTTSSLRGQEASRGNSNINLSTTSTTTLKSNMTRETTNTARITSKIGSNTSKLSSVTSTTPVPIKTPTAASTSTSSKNKLASGVSSKTKKTTKSSSETTAKNRTSMVPQNNTVIPKETLSEPTESPDNNDDINDSSVDLNNSTESDDTILDRKFKAKNPMIPPVARGPSSTRMKKKSTSSTSLNSKVTNNNTSKSSIGKSKVSSSKSGIVNKSINGKY